MKSSLKTREVPPKRVPPVVKGPIRCHKCQLVCQTAAEYLSHTCEQQRLVHDSQTRRLIDGLSNGTFGRR
jgi:hypothetical protein